LFLKVITISQEGLKCHKRFNTLPSPKKVPTAFSNYMGVFGLRNTSILSSLICLISGMEWLNQSPLIPQKLIITIEYRHEEWVGMNS
jgi:hypothetical protein